ncbi:molybdopterin molybdotransferase MoeA [Ottowia thiooxydans]|uniref:Molybdopterin molybdenumtransferase n=1 Tax=Ottowia thiooxydans TaxID=219182 RepID=A0ABV2QEP3_9BURK
MKSIAQIAARLQGYDPQSLTTERVSAFLNELVAPVTETEQVALFDALGRVLAEDIVSPVSVPPHDNSAMDGFAFNGAQLQPDLPLRLQVVGTAFAGKAWQGTVGIGKCVKIMTGAVMPAGLDTVVPLEFARVQGDAVSIPANVLKCGDNRRHLGEDLMAGHTALAQGERLGPAALGLLASLGLGQVQVYRRIRVAYFSTGDEILSAGEAPREGAVYDSNRYTVIGMLKQLGCEVVDLGVVRDEPALLEKALLQATARADAVITSGGVSAGEADHTRTLMQKLGDMAFWRVAMRPGRPMAVGHISAPAAGAQSSDGVIAPTSSALLFGLPGNPVAVMVTFIAFVRPALLRMMGASPKPQIMLRAVSESPIQKKPGRTEYQRCIVTPRADGQPTVRITGNQGSGVLSSMVQANGLLVLEHEQGPVAAGDEVNVLMLDDL